MRILLNKKEFNEIGFQIMRDAISDNLLSEVKSDLLMVSRHLGVPEYVNSIDAAWNYFKQHDRAKGGLMYNAFKRLPSVYRLSSDISLLNKIRNVTKFVAPALIDVNCRIDSHGEEKYLFDWHQDYWFSVSSTNAVVVWIPLEKIDEGTGGIELMSMACSGDKVYKTTSGNNYNSYADAVKLAEELPSCPIIDAPMDVGDMLIFKFNVLHRSKPVVAKDRSRFTMQLRFVDLADPQFMFNNYKPATVSAVGVNLMREGN
jgi:hypothetical protein